MPVRLDCLQLKIILLEFLLRRNGIGGISGALGQGFGSPLGTVGEGSGQEECREHGVLVWMEPTRQL